MQATVLPYRKQVYSDDDAHSQFLVKLHSLYFIDSNTGANYKRIKSRMSLPTNFKQSSLSNRTPIKSFHSMTCPDTAPEASVQLKDYHQDTPDIQKTSSSPFDREESLQLLGSQDEEIAVVASGDDPIAITSDKDEDDEIFMPRKKSRPFFTSDSDVDTVNAISVPEAVADAFVFLSEKTAESYEKSKPRSELLDANPIRSEKYPMANKSIAENFNESGNIEMDDQFAPNSISEFLLKSTRTNPLSFEDIPHPNESKTPCHLTSKSALSFQIDDSDSDVEITSATFPRSRLSYNAPLCSDDSDMEPSKTFSPRTSIALPSRSVKRTPAVTNQRKTYFSDNEITITSITNSRPKSTSSPTSTTSQRRRLASEEEPIVCSTCSAVLEVSAVESHDCSLTLHLFSNDLFSDDGQKNSASSTRKRRSSSPLVTSSTTRRKVKPFFPIFQTKNDEIEDVSDGEGCGYNEDEDAGMGEFEPLEGAKLRQYEKQFADEGHKKTGGSARSSVAAKKTRGNGRKRFKGKARKK